MSHKRKGNAAPLYLFQKRRGERLTQKKILSLKKGQGPSLWFEKKIATG